jgi:hypothetical protein
MPDNAILRARRQVITAAHIQETPAQVFSRTFVDIAGAIAVIGAAALAVWAVFHG